MKRLDGGRMDAGHQHALEWAQGPSTAGMQWRETRQAVDGRDKVRAMAPAPKTPVEAVSLKLGLRKPKSLSIVTQLFCESQQKEYFLVRPGPLVVCLFTRPCGFHTLRLEWAALRIRSHAHGRR